MVKDGKLVVKDADGNEVADHKYVASGKSTLILSSETPCLRLNHMFFKEILNNIYRDWETCFPVTISRMGLAPPPQ